MFCGYIVRQLEQAKALASKEELVRRALDKDFVPNDQYAELFLSEIPLRLRLEVFFGVYESVKDWNIRPIYYFNKCIINHFNKEERQTVIEAISNDLKTTDDESVIRHLMSGIPARLWLDMAEIARLRIENKVIGSIRDGKYDSKSKRCLSGALATWSRSQFTYFMLKRELITVIAAKFSSSDSQAIDYAFQYLVHGVFQDHNLEELSPIHRVFIRKLKEGSKQFHNALMFTPEEKWNTEMKDAYSNFSGNTETILDDEIPF